MKRILIVDDEPEQLRSFRVGLKTRGYSTMEALSAQSALQQLHEVGDRVALVLTDYAMPGMDGLSLLRQIRDTSKALPVIVMSAYGSDSLIAEVLLAGCDAFMEKPFTLDELIEAIKRIGCLRAIWDSGRPVVTSRRSRHRNSSNAKESSRCSRT